jgi:hypothetical protein
MIGPPPECPCTDPKCPKKKDLDALVEEAVEEKPCHPCQMSGESDDAATAVAAAVVVAAVVVVSAVAVLFVVAFVAVFD